MRKRVARRGFEEPLSSLHPRVMLAINTRTRANETRGFKWQQVDFLANLLTVDKSKTAARGQAASFP